MLILVKGKMMELKSFKELMTDRFNNAESVDDYKDIGNICHGALLVCYAFASLDVANEVLAMRDKSFDKYYEIKRINLK